MSIPAECRPATITITVNDRVIAHREPLACPHISSVIKIGLRDLLRSVLRRGATVRVDVDEADRHDRDGVRPAHIDTP